MYKRYLKRALLSFEVSFLFLFMLLIFGPSEIFFANVSEFQFIYGEFAPVMTLLAIGIAIIVSILISFLPDKVFRFPILLGFGIIVAGYIQIMFLNKGLDLLGLNPEGYLVDTGKIIINLCIWLVVMIASILLVLLKKELWKKIVIYGCAFLACIQIIALVSLFFTAPDRAYKREEGIWHLSGEEQYTVSANKNVIVILLDFFSNTYIEPLEAAYPGATEFLNDFTYYSNMDCVYFGTFPSIPHIMTGQELDMGVSINDWCQNIWNNDRTVQFYNELKANNYKTNLYTPDTNILCGLNSPKIMDGKISNVIDSGQEVEVNKELLVKTLFKMSGYRMFPEILKPSFYANIDEYSDVVKVLENPINHNNYDFYDGLIQKGLQVDQTSNYYIVQHLMGPHLYTTDENGEYKETSTLEETTKGCMVIVEEYLNQLKNLGVYDNSTIILTADHGEGYNSQVIYYVKQPGEKHDTLQVTDAPASFNEFLPTIAYAAGLDYKKYGNTIYNFSDGEKRERTVWLRWMDEAYPEVPCYSGDKDGADNVYYGFTYTGNLGDLQERISQGPSIITPQVDAYF